MFLCYTPFCDLHMPVVISITNQLLYILNIGINRSTATDAHFIIVIRVRRYVVSPNARMISHTIMIIPPFTIQLFSASDELSVLSICHLGRGCHWFRNTAHRMPLIRQHRHLPADNENQSAIAIILFMSTQKATASAGPSETLAPL